MVRWQVIKANGQKWLRLIAREVGVSDGVESRCRFIPSQAAIVNQTPTSFFPTEMLCRCAESNCNFFFVSTPRFLLPPRNTNTTRQITNARGYAENRHKANTDDKSQQPAERRAREQEATTNHEYNRHAHAVKE